jgi:hypothetical protein
LAVVMLIESSLFRTSACFLGFKFLSLGCEDLFPRPCSNCFVNLQMQLQSW